MTNIVLMAPLSGFLMPIEQVPDPVFAEKMLGDGIALDPISNALLAPCDGRVIQLHDANHALTIATPEGIEILMHIGLDTVALRGEGFLAHVHKGDEVTTGQKLIEFDPDFVAQRAPSLLTMVVIVNSDQLLELGKAKGEVTAAETVIMNLSTNGDTETAVGAGEELSVTSEPIIIPNHSGLHARPAAVLASLARNFDSSLRLIKGEESANARSVISIMNLNVAFEDEVTLQAEGPDAQEAINSLAPAVENGLGEEGAAAIAAPASVAQPATSAPPPRPRSEDPRIILGAAASPGVAVGNIHQFRRQEIEIEAHLSDDPIGERIALDQAIAQSTMELEALQARLHGESDPGKAAIFAAHEELLHDPDLLDMAQDAIDNNLNAAYAWQTAINTQAGRLEEMSNELLAMRAADLRDVGRRVLRHLTGVEGETLEVPVNTVLIAEDLAPSDIANLDRDRVVGFATTLGGATSHVAILARSLDLPAIAGIEARALDLPDGTPVILNATRARLQLNPSKEEIAYVVGMLRKRKQKREADLATALDPAITTDGHAMEVAANISSEADAEQGVPLGADGVGLLRTEFLFMERRTAPTEEEQAETYAAIAGVLGRKKPLIIRTLDVGGDKPLAYLPIAPENNPFLGERGIRVGLDRPELLRTQIRAILRASSAGGNIHIMFPMIATLQEWRMAKAMVDEEVENLAVEPVPVGIMIEVPAAAIMAEQFAREAEFFSIGTNDLTQYILAMDRGHPKLAPLVDGLNPAVLRLIAQTAAGARKHGRWVGVCGGMAGDPQAVPILMGLGVKELSVAVPMIPTIKALIRSISLQDARKQARHALTLDSAADVRALYPLEDYEL